MNFFPGQVLVHPHHGPATVAHILSRDIQGQPRRYLSLDVHHAELSIAVPMDRVEEIGVRPILDPEGARAIFDVLVAPSEERETVWSRRIKNNTDRLRTGDIHAIAGLIRDLTRWNADKPLSFAEGKLLRDARAPFLAEFALVLSMSEDEATATVDAAILDGTLPTVPEAELAAAS